MTSTHRRAVNRENSRNGKRSKTIVTQAAGQVRIEVPRGTGTPTFSPQSSRSDSAGSRT